MIIDKRNNLTIAMDKLETVDTVSFVYGVETGSTNETAENNGISHFLEHMAFKGTQKRNYFQIAKEIDDVGGHINAYTSKERTVYYVKLMKQDLGLGIDIISDIVQNSVFPLEEIEKERGVILQELASSLDTPEDVVFDYFYNTAFSKSPLGRTILGPAENIKKLQKNDFQNYVNDRYSAQNSVISVCGNFDHEFVLKEVENRFNFKNFEVKKNDRSIYTPGECIKHKDSLEQTQFLLGFESCKYLSEDLYSISVLANILGSGMSSRLFQEVREKLGLVYDVSCWNSAYKDCGLFSIYAGTSSENVGKLCEVLKTEMKKICTDVTDDEIKRAINQTKASVVMAKESTDSRSQKACSDILKYQKYIEYEEIVEKVASITKEDVCNAARKIFTSPPVLTIYGNTKGVSVSVEDFNIR